MNFDWFLSHFGSVGIDVSRLMVELTVEGTAVFALALFVTWLWQKPSSSIRYLILMLSLLSTMVFPVLDATIPCFGLGAACSSVLDIAMPLQLDVFAKVSPGGEAVGSEVNWALYFIYVWFSGVCVLLMHLAAGMLRMQRLVSRSEEIRSKGLMRVALKCKERLAVRREVSFRQSDKVSVPFSWGWRHPAVVLPGSASRWSRRRSEEVLLHELAHVKRLDFFSNLLALLTRALYWFNPLVWVIVSRLRFERECAADEYVLHAGVCATDYARSLVEIARSIGAVHRPALCSMEIIHKPKLKGRIMRILRANNRRVTSSLAVKLTVVAVALGATVLVSGISLSAEQETPPAVSSAAQEEPTRDALSVPDTMIQELDNWPEATRLEQPEYPKAAKAAGIEGSVWIRVLVDDAGVVRDCEVEKSSGFDMLDSAALKASCKGQWKPAMLDGEPIAVWVSYKVKFDLEDNKKPADDEE